MKCKDCLSECPHRTSDAEKECVYSDVLGHEPMTFEQMKEIETMRLQHDWEGLRNQAAIAAMQGILSNSDSFKQYCTDEKYKDVGSITRVIALASCMYADKLIEQLKRNEE